MRSVQTVVVFCMAGLLAITSSGCGAVGTDYEEGMTDNFYWLMCTLMGQRLHQYNEPGGPYCTNFNKSLPKTAVASAGEELFISATAHATGALDTNWRSDVEIHNLSESTGTVTIRLLIQRTSNTPSPSTTLNIPPGESVRLADVIDSEFNRDGGAALLISVESGRIIATSRTFNLLSSGNELGLPDGSTFGQYIPSRPSNRAIHHGEEGRLIQLSHSTDDEEGARTNIGIVNATPFDLSVQIDLHDAYDGTKLGTVPVNLGPFGYRQVNKIFNKVTSGDVFDGYAVVRSTSPDSTFFAYASVIDNLTGDPIAITAMPVPELEPQGVGEPTWVVAAANVEGEAGTNWRTDLEVHNWGDATARYRIDLLRHGADNGEPTSFPFSLSPGTSERFNNVLFGVFDFDGTASLRIRPVEGHILVTSRTYNLIGENDPDGLPEDATFGQYIPGVDEREAIRFGEEGRLIQLSNTPGFSSGFRTNLVLVNATYTEIEVEYDLYRGDGTFLGTKKRTLAPLEYRQVNRVFETVTKAEIDDGFAVVRTTTENGAFFALGSVVDNLTGDPIGIGAVRIHSSGADGIVGQLDAGLDVLGGTTIESAVGGIQAVGIDGIMDAFVSSRPGVVSRTAEGMVIDYGEGTVVEDGSVWSGSVTVDTSGATIDSSEISGLVMVEVDDLEVNGEPIGSSTLWILSIQERADGTVVGDISAIPVDGNAAAGSVSGEISIDTAICEKYPIAGSLTFVSGGEVTTITPSPDCDGSLVPDIVVMPLGYDFVFTSADPWDPRSNAFMTAVSNAEVSREGEIGGYWRPVMGGETFEETTPGLINFRYSFDRPVAGGELKLDLATFHFWYSRGHAFLYGAADGSDWQLLTEVEPPAEGTGRAGGWNGPLPDLFIGATDIRLQVRLYSYGSKANLGGVYCNTAQMFRYDPRLGGDTFRLMVDLED